MWLNWVIEKSAASDACRPSLPTIPMPTLAAWIIETSLPPSPVDENKDEVFNQNKNNKIIIKKDFV